MKYEVLHFYSKYKYKIWLIGFILILFLLTGIFTALKISDIEKAIKSVKFSFEAIADESIYDFSFFIKRYLSILLVMGLLFLFSLNKYLCIFGYALIGYRAFLITLNCVMIIRYMGVGGIINSIVIILPCQIIQLVLMSIMYIILCARRKEKKECGVSKKYTSVIIAIIVGAFLVNIIELLLLLIFKASTILII